MKGRNLDAIFNECYERMLGGESLESCLARYPKTATKLEPLLRTAADVHDLASSFQVSPEFKMRARLRLENAFVHHQWFQKRAKAKRGFSWHGRWAMAMAVVLVVVLAGGGTVAASTQALPDEPLYPVKIAAEQARLAFTFSDIEKAKLHTQLAEKRAQEIYQVSGSTKPASIAATSEKMSSHLEQADTLTAKSLKKSVATSSKAQPVPSTSSQVDRELAPTAPRAAASAPEATGATEANKTKSPAIPEELRKLVRDSGPRSIAILEQALIRAPEQSKPALRLALEMAKKRYAKLIEETEDEGTKLPLIPFIRNDKESEGIRNSYDNGTSAAPKSANVDDEANPRMVKEPSELGELTAPAQFIEPALPSPFPKPDYKSVP